MVTREKASLVVGDLGLWRTTNRHGLTPIFQFRRFQKIVIAGGIQRQVAYSLGVHQHVVVIPQIDVGQFVGQDALDFCVELFAGVLVEFLAGLIDQCVDPRVGEVSAVGAVGREFGGVENVFEDVRVFVAADPAQGIESGTGRGSRRRKRSRTRRCGYRARFPPGAVAAAAPPPSAACFLPWTISW